MSTPQIHGRYRTVPASLLLKAIGDALEEIKDEDKATDADLGAVLGKHEDTAARYRTGLAEMPVVSFLRGCREWDGRFANAALGLVGMRLAPIDAAAGCDRASVTALCSLLAKKSAALENDGVIDDDELEDMWPELEAAAKHIDRLRDRRRLRMISNQ
jgi:succinyl-CoA synthetase alpha subunit